LGKIRCAVRTADPFNPSAGAPAPPLRAPFRAAPEGAPAPTSPPRSKAATEQPVPVDVPVEARRDRRATRPATERMEISDERADRQHDLTPNRPTGATSTWRPASRSRRRRSDVENPTTPPSLGASSAPTADASPKATATPCTTSSPWAHELDTAAQHAVNGLRAFGYSWA
jgi:hypothetical protein